MYEQEYKCIYMCMCVYMDLGLSTALMSNSQKYGDTRGPF